MLGPQVAQGLGQLALKVLLAPAVDLQDAGLVAAPGLAQLLHTRTDSRGRQAGDEKQR